MPPPVVPRVLQDLDKSPVRLSKRVSGYHSWLCYLSIHCTLYLKLVVANQTEASGDGDDRQADCESTNQPFEEEAKAVRPHC